MGLSESTISDLRDLTLATGFTFQNVEENLLFVYVKEGVKVCCTYSKPRVKKKSYFLEKWLEVNQSVCFVTISNILGPVYTERHVNAAHFKAMNTPSGSGKVHWNALCRSKMGRGGNRF